MVASSSSKINDFFKHDSAGAILLLLFAGIAMLLANSPLVGIYDGILSTPVQVRFADFEIAKPLQLWINDGLMAVFFFLVGLEVKREVRVGHLSSKDQILLPLISAIAGIILPALIYYYAGTHDETTIRGWAIPSATDIAFALGVFGLFGSRVPVTVKLFLLSVAIFDDVGAIIIIAIFYSTDLSMLSLIIAFSGLVVLFIFNRLRVNRQAAYLAIGIVVWAAVLKSGVHATLAGFAVAWFIPMNAKNENGIEMLPYLEHTLRPWVAFVILPVFAFANAGVTVEGIAWSNLLDPIPLGIILGLLVGKQVGIFGTAWLIVKLGLAKLPKGTNWMHMYAVSVLCGIGFTMNIFIGSLAFSDFDPLYMKEVKIGVIIGSFISAVLGSFLIARCQPAPRVQEDKAWLND